MECEVHREAKTGDCLSFEYKISHCREGEGERAAQEDSTEFFCSQLQSGKTLRADSKEERSRGMQQNLKRAATELK
jgi:hypothetical protein